MLELGDSFLEEVGLEKLPSDLAAPFLQHVYETLEERVGEALAEGFSTAQIDQLEAIIGRRSDTITSWLETHEIVMTEDPVYVRMVEETPHADAEELRAVFVATKWLEANRPDYREVVADQMENLKAELVLLADRILDES